MSTIERPATILGGLPVIAVICSGKDGDTPEGPGEYWSEVDALYWRKRNGTKGKPLPQHIIDRAEKYDYAFCNLIEGVFEEESYERWAEAHPEAAAAQESQWAQLLGGFSGA